MTTITKPCMETLHGMLAQHALCHSSLAPVYVIYVTRD